MAGYQTIEALRPILHRGPVPTPVVDRSLLGPKRARVKTWCKGKAIPADVVAEIIARRQCGEGYNKIAREVGVTHGSIRRHAGHITPPAGGWADCWATGARKRAIQDEDKEFIRRLRRSGFSYEEIGAELGCSANAVRRFFVPAEKLKGRRAPISALLWKVALATGVPRHQLRKIDDESRKVRSQVKARQIAFFLLKTRNPEMSFPVIGRSMGGFHHTSVMHGVRKVTPVAEAIGITSDMPARRVARLLWEADWCGVGK